MKKLLANQNKVRLNSIQSQPFQALAPLTIMPA